MHIYKIIEKFDLTALSILNASYFENAFSKVCAQLNIEKKERKKWSLWETQSGKKFRVILINRLNLSKSINLNVIVFCNGIMKEVKDGCKIEEKVSNNDDDNDDKCNYFVQKVKNTFEKKINIIIE